MGCYIGVVLTKTSFATEKDADIGAYPPELKSQYGLRPESMVSLTYRSYEH